MLLLFTCNATFIWFSDQSQKHSFVYYGDLRLQIWLGTSFLLLFINHYSLQSDTNQSITQSCFLKWPFAEIKSGTNYFVCWMLTVVIPHDSKLKFIGLLLKTTFYVTHIIPQYVNEYLKSVYEGIRHYLQSSKFLRSLNRQKAPKNYLYLQNISMHLKSIKYTLKLFVVAHFIYFANNYPANDR